MAKAKRKTINIALQGGGSHGAYAWGVLDALLEDDRIDFGGITAASAGAMNAAVMTYGLAIGGAKGAREQLDRFWTEVSKLPSPVKAFSNPFLDQFAAVQSTLEWASYLSMGAVSQTMSPYQFNPLNINPLRDILDKTVDFDELHACTKSRLYISATNVRSGKVKVFKTGDVTLDAVMASACLPELYQAVEVDGEFYWDGGYAGNPPLWPLFYDRESQDVLVVMLNPMLRKEIPKTAAEIQNRENEIAFNSSLLKEMRAVSFVQKLISKDMLKEEFRDAYNYILFHNIRADKDLSGLSIASKYNTNLSFLTDLKNRGRKAAQEWLIATYDKLGKEASVSLRDEFFED